MFDLEVLQTNLLLVFCQEQELGSHKFLELLMEKYVATMSLCELLAEYLSSS